jgi:tetratricopeptide (TPR) repeat protein
MVVPRGAIAPLLVALVTLTAGAPAVASPSSQELVRQAQAREGAGQDDIAARRYTDAIVLDATDRAAYLGLGALRLRDGDAREAERVYDLALARLPEFPAALLGRAEARWVAGEHLDAETDLEAYAVTAGDTRVYQQLASWYAIDGLYPAELALYRRLLASDDPDPKTAALVRALEILVGPADPATQPATNDGTRRGLARMARMARMARQAH